MTGKKKDKRKNTNIFNKKKNKTKKESKFPFFQ